MGGGSHGKMTSHDPTEEEIAKTRRIDYWTSRNRAQSNKAQEISDFEDAAKAAGRQLVPPPDETEALIQSLNRTRTERRLRTSSSAGMRNRGGKVF